MIEIEKARIECVEQSADNTYARFVIEPLESGFGNTLGNALRRVLLSSLPGRCDHQHPDRRRNARVHYHSRRRGRRDRADFEPKAAVL